ncbi:MAG: hypothetical protein JNL22_10810 [Bacteroidales bacterium]|nr:hypothetical protein [Bacteroidales bacterium]
MESLKSEIDQLLVKITQKYDNLPEGPVSSIETDIILGLLRELYEMTELLRIKPDSSTVGKTEIPHYGQPINVVSAPANVPVVEIPVPEPPAVVPPVIPPMTVSSQDTFHSENIPVTADIPKGEEPVVSVSQFRPEEEFARDSGYVMPSQKAEPTDLFGQISLGEKLKTEIPSVKDKITQHKTDRTIADRIQLKPISDLKSAIGINEKFQFINELFEGSAERYNEALNLLNNCSSAAEAMQLVADFKARYNWDAHEPSAGRLIEFITRRYL